VAAGCAAAAGEADLLARLLEAAHKAPAAASEDLDSLKAHVLPTAYHQAASTGKAAICQVLMQHHPQLVPTELAEGKALHAAVRNGHVEVVCTVLDACQATLQADVYQRLRRDVLRAACRQAAQVAIVKAVLSRGADVNAGYTEFTAHSPLASAIDLEAEEVLWVLLENGAYVHAEQASWGHDDSALVYAASKCKLLACRVLLESARVTVGRRELITAVKSRDVSILTLLLGSAANVEASAQQDEQHRATCLGRALAAAVKHSDSTNHDTSVMMVKALLAPPIHWGPVTGSVIQEGLIQAAELWESGRATGAQGTACWPACLPRCPSPGGAGETSCAMAAGPATDGAVDMAATSLPLLADVKRWGNTGYSREPDHLNIIKLLLGYPWARDVDPEHTDHLLALAVRYNNDKLWDVLMSTCIRYAGGWSGTHYSHALNDAQQVSCTLPAIVAPGGSSSATCYSPVSGSSLSRLLHFLLSIVHAYNAGGHE
jgi:hypothetical protein